MTQEYKSLLLKDLCSRLPYGTLVFIRKPFGCVMSETEEEELTATTIQEFIENDDMHVFPYLRPMSSMTEEEKKEYGKVCELDTEILANHPMNGEPFPALYNSQDWLNANHFDYRGLIEKGLAIEVTKENNPYEQNKP